MTNRECVQAILHYQPCDRIPVVSFGFWTETLRKWRDEGHIPPHMVYDRPMADVEYDAVNAMLGFDFNWNSTAGVGQYLLEPTFPEAVIEEFPDGKQKVLDKEGNYVIVKPGIISIPSGAGHTLMDRDSWVTHYLPRLSYGKEVVDHAYFDQLKQENNTRENPLGLFCGSMLGRIRNWLGLENLAYLGIDDPELLEENGRRRGQPDVPSGGLSAHPGRTLRLRPFLGGHLRQRWPSDHAPATARTGWPTLSKESQHYSSNTTLTS